MTFTPHEHKRDLTQRVLTGVFGGDLHYLTPPGHTVAVQADLVEAFRNLDQGELSGWLLDRTLLSSLPSPPSMAVWNRGVQRFG